MKKNDLILILSVASYSILFYNQSAGINFIFFTAILITCLLIKDRNLIKKKQWQIAALGCILSALSIGMYGTAFSVVANILSLSILSALSMSENTSVIVSLLFSFYSYWSSVFYIYVERISPYNNENAIVSPHSMKKAGFTGIAILITLIFFFMYRESNALFNEFAAKINLDFISFGWILFTLGGLILLYGFYHHKRINEIDEFDKNASNDLQLKQE